MVNGGSRVLYNSAIALSVACAGAAAVRYLPTIPWDSWPQLALFSALTIYLHARTVKVENRMNYSLGTAVFFPVLYIYGVGAAMIVTTLAAVVDSVAHKKTVDRMLFNAAQLSLSAVVCGTVYGRLGGTFGYAVSLADIWPLLIAGFVYIVINVSLVVSLSAMALGRAVRSRLRGLLRTMDKDFSAGFWGVVFTLFVAEYSTWGIILLGMVFAQFSRFIEMGVKMSVERGMRQELERELLIDSKTGVYNFRYLTEWLADPAVDPTAVLFIDIDDFKAFNDRHGHPAGDEALITLANLIKSVIRADDAVIRYGGEEFVVLLPNMTRAGAKRVARRIQTSLKNVRFPRRDQSLTVSIGIAACPEDTKDKHHLLGLADQAMYEAKRSGKDCCHSWGESAVVHSV